MCTVLDVNSRSWQGEIERDEITLYSAMMVELLTTKREMGDDNKNDVDMGNQGYDLPDWVGLTLYR